ncbi:adenylate/guanylate cyclase domain-containing protein [Inquilinus sp. YAF38]|uniref:adenylate/guanylate cyclase domain-containing protein n=1 Tax=Inquilinus sp. YAF38 TaxID=3233084 RepID=UPI003F938656
MDRRLAAVLIADVVGYGRLSQIDEEGTRARFQSDLKEVFEPKFAAHHGRLIKTMGDGILAEFQSVVEALRCALEIQQGKADRNAVARPEHRIDFRVGINLGDIIVEGEDIHGDGVNIADRIQSLAEAGGIAISGTAYDQVKAKVPVGYASLGERKLKSIAEPVRVYRVVTDPMAAGRTIGARKRPRSWRTLAGAFVLVFLALTAATAWWRLWAPASEPAAKQNVAAADDRPSLVVLPFDNLSDDKEQGYLADGITEDLTTDLARLTGLFVVSRNAAFTYKGRDVPPAQIASELGVRYLLEGSVRRAGDDMRISAQLIDTTTGGHLWAERYDGAWADVFDFQDKIVSQIATSLKLRLIAGQRAAQIAGGTSNPAAYEAYLRGVELEHRGEPKDLAKAVEQFEQAVALDPDFGAAIAELSWAYWTASGVGSFENALSLSGDETAAKSNDYLEDAARHPSPGYYQLLADRLLPQQKSDEAIVAAERAIALDSSDPYAYHEMSYALTLNGRAADGLGFLSAAARIDPNWTTWRHYLAGLSYFSLSRFEEAVASLERIDFRIGNDTDVRDKYLGLELLIAAEGHLGHAANAASAREKIKPYLMALNYAEFTGLAAIQDLPFKSYADLDRVLDGLRKAGVPDLPFGFDPKSKDRLSGSEIKALLFGHGIRGREVVPAVNPYRRTTTIDGSFSATIGTQSVEGVSRIEGDAMCTFAPLTIRSCRVVFRNPGGTLDLENEYLFFRDQDRYEFSVIR